MQLGRGEAQRAPAQAAKGVLMSSKLGLIGCNSLAGARCACPSQLRIGHRILATAYCPSLYIRSGTLIPNVASAAVNWRRAISAAAIKTAFFVWSSSAMIRCRW